MKDLSKTQVNFTVKGKPMSFVVYHNLSETHGLSIEDAVNGWSLRCKSTTALSLCNYIMDKAPSFVCMTEGQMERLNKLGTTKQTWNVSQITNLFNPKTPWKWGAIEFITAATLAVLAGLLLRANGLI